MSASIVALRRHRAAVAETLLRSGRTSAHAVDWASLGEAPAWLGWPAPMLERFALRVGTVMLAPALRLWIAMPAIKTAQAAMGGDWWARLMAHGAWPEVPIDWPHALGLEAQRLDAQELAATFRAAGHAVLLATLPHGSLRHAASEALAPLGHVVMPQVQALALVDLTTALEQNEASA